MTEICRQDREFFLSLPLDETVFARRSQSGRCGKSCGAREQEWSLTCLNCAAYASFPGEAAIDQPRRDLSRSRSFEHSMAVNRMRAALAAPRKGETFELRSGLVYVFFRHPQQSCNANVFTAPNMPMKGTNQLDPASPRSNRDDLEKRLYKRPSWL